MDVVQKWLGSVHGFQHFKEAFWDLVVPCMPTEVAYMLGDLTVVTCSYERDGLFLPAEVLHDKAVIVLSEKFGSGRRIMRSKTLRAEFVRTCLRELAHVYLEHKSPLSPDTSPELFELQRKRAEELSQKWLADCDSDVRTGSSPKAQDRNHRVE